MRVRKYHWCLDSYGVVYWQSFLQNDILDTLPFQAGAGGRWLCVLFTRYSEWNFGEYYFRKNSDDLKKAQSKKTVVTKNTVSCNSRCFWVSRRLVSFLESSEQISRFGAAFKKPPPKRRFLVHQQGLEPGTRWLRVSCSNNSNRLRETHQLLNQFNLLNCCIMKIRPCRIFQ